MMSQETQAKQPRSSTNLATTMAATFVLLSVLTLLAVGSYLIYQDYYSQQRLIVSLQRVEASRAATQVASFIEQLFNTLDAAARVGRLNAVATGERRLWLDNLLGAHPALRTLSFVDEKGEELSKVSRVRLVSPSELTSYAGTELFKQTQQSQRFIGPVFLDKITYEPLIILGIPVTNVFGDFEGTLIAEINLKFMWDVVDQIEVGQTGVAYVVDRQGNLIAFRDRARVLQGENVSHLFEVAEFIEGNEEEAETIAESSVGITGETVLSTYLPLGTPDWAVIIESPAREAYQGVIQSITVSLAILVLTAVLAGAAGIYASRRLAAPLLNLTNTATRMAEGELNLEVQPEGPTEIVSLANAFNSMTHQLRELIDSLEQQVTARTRRLETVAILSERLAAILNVDELLAEMVNQIKDTFGYYHAHVYLLDDKGEKLVVAQGTGPAGAEMKAVGHYIPLNAFHSLVARAARSGEIVRIDNVRESPDWLPNSLLPDTYSEMVVPIILEGQVVGVLDVQESRIAGLDEADANLLRSLVNQVAIAIRNARLFNQVETALGEAYATQERYVEQSWEKTKIAEQGGRHLYLGPQAIPPDETKQEIMAKVREEILDRASPQELTTHGHKIAPLALAAPIRLGNTTIGDFQLYRTESNEEWTEDDLAVIEAVMEQLAQTAENLRLFTETREQASFERLVGDITQKIRQAPTLEMLARTAAELLSEVLDVSGGTVSLNAGPDPASTKGENGHVR